MIDRQRKSTVLMWCNLVLSALLCSLSFLYMPYVGWFIVVFWVPLWWVFTKQKVARLFLYGFAWGGVAFSLHFLWLLHLLRLHSTASLCLSIMLYSIVVAYAALTTAVLFWLIGAIVRRLRVQSRVVISSIALVCSAVYVLVMTQHMFWFLGREHGYPLINPMLPLIGFVQGDVTPEKIIAYKGYTFVYIHPARSTDPDGAAEEIYELLRQKKGRDVMYVGPETTFPFALNHKPKFAKLWGKALRADEQFVLGACNKKATKNFQAIYQVNSSRITHAFCKTHCVSLSEKIPKFWRNFQWTRKLFLKDKSAFKKEKMQTGKGRVMQLGMLSITPVMCSELFLKSTEWLAHVSKDANLIVALINDRWFPMYAQSLLYALAVWKMLSIKKPLLYVTHTGMVFFKKNHPESSFC